MGEEIWSNERLASAVVIFGWNYKVDSEEAPSRNVDVIIQADRSYEIIISGYDLDPGAFENEAVVLAKTQGNLSPELAKRLRRNLAQLRSEQGLGTTMPDCLARLPRNIESYVGFENDQTLNVTILEPYCETAKTLEGRRIIAEALAEFPKLAPVKLMSGQIAL